MNSLIETLIIILIFFITIIKRVLYDPINYIIKLISNKDVSYQKYFSNKVILITGATSGIGEALVNTLAKNVTNS